MTVAEAAQTVAIIQELKNRFVLLRGALEISSVYFARGGSKGLPRKNVRLFNGRPLICYSIQTALECPSIECVYVSTDDEEIAEVAGKEGAEVIVRPKELCSDTSPEILSWKHAIELLRAGGKTPVKFISLPATSPLRNVSDVETAIEKHTQSPTLISVLQLQESSKSPYFNMVSLAQDSRVELLLSGSSAARRQDAPIAYDLTTVVYVATPSYVEGCSSLFEGHVVGVEVPKERSIDIDDIFDFRFAETLMKEQG